MDSETHAVEAAREAAADFFVAHADADTAWAEWIADVLEAAGYQVRVQGQVIRPGHNRLEMQDRALTQCRHVLAVMSPSYLADEDDAVRTAAHQQTLIGKDRAFIPVRVLEHQPIPLLGPIVVLNLVDVTDEAEARRRLIDGVALRVPTQVEPRYPGASRERRTSVRFPATVPPIWEMRGRRSAVDFVGREELLQNMHRQLRSGSAAAFTQAIGGLGGVGKTRLTVEYAYRYGRSYELVWWIRAERIETLFADFAELASPLGLPQAEKQDDGVAAVRQELGRRSNWLLIFDNADDPTSLERLIPEHQSGHVLITTRRKTWPYATSLPVDVLPADAAVEYLCIYGRADPASATALAAALGYLPLALAQAAAVLADGMPAHEYLRLLEIRAPDLFAEGAPRDTQTTIMNTWRVSLDHAAQTPGAAELLRLCAFLAPDNVSLEHLPPVDGLLGCYELAGQSIMDI